MYTGTISIAESPVSNVRERFPNASAAGSALVVAHVERLLQRLEGVQRPQEPLLAPARPQSPTSVVPSGSRVHLLRCRLCFPLRQQLVQLERQRCIAEDTALNGPSAVCFFLRCSLAMEKLARVLFVVGAEVLVPA